MPLENGSSRQVISHNVAVEVRAGKPAAQAAAIAYRKAGETDDDLPGSKPLDRSLRFYAPVKLSENISETKEGFLICRDVCIARTGEMLYKGDEIENVTPSFDGIVRITRDGDELFRPETLASFEGKPVCDDHPLEDVTPETWSLVSLGHMQNVHQGEGDLKDFMLADILVMDKDGISAIRSGGKREVSLGYDADYEQIEPGRGRQKNIVGNHIALVDRGRCGPRCAIRDRRPNMSKPTSLLSRLRAAFKDGDEKEFEKAVKDMAGEESGAGESPLQVHVHNYGPGGAPAEDKARDGETEEEKKKREDEEKKAKDSAEEKTIEQRIAALEEMIKKLSGTKYAGQEETENGKLKADTTDESLVEEEKKEEKKDEGKTHDADSVYSDFSARAEILAPGVKMPRPTRDAMANPKKIRDAICICKRRALDAAMKIDRSKEAVGKFLNTRDGASIDKMSCDRVDAVFVGASELLKAENMRKVSTSTQTKDGASVNPHSRGGLDAINQAFWAGK